MAETEGRPHGLTLKNVFGQTGSAVSGPSFKFSGTFNHGVRGKILAQSLGVVMTMATRTEPAKPKLDKNGNEQPQVAILLQTKLKNWADVAKVPSDEASNPMPPESDDGKRVLYAKHRMIRAIGAAIEAAGADPNDGLVDGSDLAVRHIANIEVGAPNPLPDFDAKYWPAAPVSASADVFGDDEGHGVPAAAPAPAPVATPAPAATPEPQPVQPVAAPVPAGTAEYDPFADDEPPF